MGYGYSPYEDYEDQGFDVRYAAPRSSPRTYSEKQLYTWYDSWPYGDRQSYSSTSRYGGESSSARREQPQRRGRVYAYEDPITGAYEEGYYFESRTTCGDRAPSPEPIFDEDHHSEQTEGADDDYYGDFDEGDDYFSYGQEYSCQHQRRRHDEPGYERPYNVRNAAPREQGSYNYAAHENSPRARQREPQYTEDDYEQDNRYYRSRTGAGDDDYPRQSGIRGQNTRAPRTGTYSNGRSYGYEQSYESQGQRSQGQRSRNAPPQPPPSGPLPRRSNKKPQAMEVDAAIKYIVSYEDMAWYDVLGVKASVTESELKKAYLLLSKKIHPDKCKHANAIKAFQKVSAANEGLKNMMEEEGQ